MQYQKAKAERINFDQSVCLSLAGSGNNYGSMSDFINHHFGTTQGLWNWYDNDPECFGCQFFAGADGSYTIKVRGETVTVTLSFIRAKEELYGYDIWKCSGYNGGA